MIPHKETTPEIISIAPVLDFALKYNPDLAYKDIGTITFWIASGCDIEQDILPAMKKICEWKKGVTSFNYFSKPIMAARDLRGVKDKAAAEQAAIPIERIIQSYQFKRRMELPLTEHELKVLNDYENKKAPSEERA
jgi:hypothetical protein